MNSECLLIRKRVTLPLQKLIFVTKFPSIKRLIFIQRTINPFSEMIHLSSFASLQISKYSSFYLKIRLTDSMNEKDNNSDEISLK